MATSYEFVTPFLGPCVWPKAASRSAVPEQNHDFLGFGTYVHERSQIIPEGKDGGIVRLRGMGIKSKFVLVTKMEREPGSCQSH